MKNSEKNTRNGNILRRVIVALFCVFIVAAVFAVMLCFYKPDHNALRALCSVSMDIVCMLILLILMGSFALDNFASNRTTRLFAGLLAATIWAMFLDFLNWAFDGSLEFGHLTFWFTLGSLCMGSILACMFSLYLYSYMEETHQLVQMRKRGIACAVLNLISFCLTFVLAISGTAFQFVNGHYETGALYDVVTVIPVLTLLYLTGYVIRNVKKVGGHDTFAAAGYIGFMIGGALIEAAYSIGTTYVAVSIADIFIFVMLQDAIIAQEKRKVQKWMKKSSTDELTGLLNRHAYEADIKAIEEKEIQQDLVYISVDVNSLKTINDTLGHSAGDELIVGAARCLEQCFLPYGKIYRMGGDEFVGLIYADEQTLAHLQKEIVDITKRWSGELVKSLTISCGYVSYRETQGMDVRQMALLADHRMYDAKTEYYRSSGIERRKR